MTTLELKQSVLAYVNNADSRLLKMIKALVESYDDNDRADWWDDLSKEEQMEIEEGLYQAKKGFFVSNETVMNQFKPWH